MTPQDAIRTLKLSIQSALVGEITDELYAVTCALDDKTIKIRSYYTGAIDSESTEPMRCVATEVLADFPENYTIDEEFLPIPVDEKPLMLDFWAFLRKKKALRSA